jgi:hypothetical protein
MDINEKSYALGICNWLKKQPEFAERDICKEESIFYHVAPLKYAELILRFVREDVGETSLHTALHKHIVSNSADENVYPCRDCILPECDLHCEHL